MFRKLTSRLADPFQLSDALRGLSLAPEDLPGITRESRLQGGGT